MPSPSVKALLHRVLANQARCEDLFRVLVRAAEQGRGARDVDVELLLAIVDAIGDRRFTNRQLLAHAAVAPALRDALDACGIENARQLGWLLKRIGTTTMARGLWVETVGPSHDGLLRCVRVSSSETREP